jgi:tetratricopeptide (TPR) repeat protein
MEIPGSREAYPSSVTMPSASFSVSEEVVKAFILWAAPALATALLSYFGPLADFAWSEVLRTWRGLVVLSSFLLALIAAPALSAWIAFFVFVLFLVEKLITYSYGPTFKNTGFLPIVFAGFYHAGQGGKFERTGDAILTDAKFLGGINQLLQEHRVQESLPMRVVPFRPPKVIHSRYDFEGFQRLMRRYAANNLGVLWGVVDGQGRIKSFEVTSFEGQFTGGPWAVKLIRDVGRVTQIEGANPAAVVEFLVRAHAALWGHSFCHILNTLGHWKASYQIAGNSRALFERALAQLRESTGAAGEAVLEFERQRLLPTFIAQEAINLMHGDEWEGAVDKLCEALKVNPLWPCYDAQEFADFYTHRYALDIAERFETELADGGATEGPFKAGLLAETAESAAKRAWLNEPPILQLLFNYFTLVPERVKNLDQIINERFKALTAAHPSNCFIYLYWADAVKIRARLRGAGTKRMLPLGVLDRSIRLSEQAHRLCPTLALISAKLSALYMSTATYFDVNTPEFKRRLNKATSYMGKGKLFYTETLVERERGGEGVGDAEGA